MTRIAIIGAGITGLTLGRLLSDRAEITLFEKARGVSGRIATRRIEGYEFDHGAQYFTARSLAFRQFLKPFINDGSVMQWDPRILTLAPGEKAGKREWLEPHFVAVPGMNSLCKRIQGDLRVKLQTEVLAIEKEKHDNKVLWRLHTGSDIASQYFDWVISTAPAYQTINLFKEHLPAARLESKGGLNQVTMSPCYSLMLGFEHLPALEFDLAKVNDMGIEWIISNSSKPGRNHLPSLLVLSKNDWAETHLVQKNDWVSKTMFEELESILGQELPEPLVQNLQRWRYANVEQALGADYFLDSDMHLAAAGDWCLHGRIEAAFQSAMSLSQRLENIV